MDRFSLSPAVLLGYTSLKRNAYSLSGVVENPKQPGQNKNIPFITAADYSASGFVLQPKVEIGYRFTSQLSLFAASAIALGPSFENNFNYWKPLGSPGAGNTYSYDQFVNGAAKTAAFSGHWRVTTVSIGLRYRFTRSMPSRLSMTPTTTRQTQGSSFGEKVASGLQSGSAAQAVSVSTDSTRKAPGAVSSSYAAGKAVNPGDTTSMPSRLSMTPTTTRQTQGMSFGEKVATGLQSGGSAAQMVAGNPIPGVVVKGGKNPPVKIISVTSDNKGEVILNGLEAGSYLFTLTIPEQPAADNAATAKPGSPIGGIVVKGGKNPGADFTNLTVNSKGQIGFEVLEGGDYKLIIEASGPNNTPSQKTKKVEKATSGLKDTLKTQV
ncbi:MAG: hypothetical protein JST39_03140 [Bacteroidetes bacterium]|nr:hypothetical protein [Bacteroidota bacterium]